jgi:TolB-like protein
MEPRVTVAKKPEEEKPAPVRRMPIMIGAIAVLVVAISLVIWQFYIRRPTVEPASVEKMAYPLPDKPSIAVLPFNNLSDDPAQEYFCDGMTEDLITDLSKISGIFVIARNSTFAYKGKSAKIRQVAEELGVRYVLEGSVRKADKQIRINAQLIDAVTGHHLWADRYDGNLENIFALQDKITQKIIGALAVKLTANEKNHIAFRGTDNIDAYDAFLQGWDYYLRSIPDAFRKAIPFFEKAVELDPNYGAAYAALALTYWSGSYARDWTGMLGLSSVFEGRLLARHYLEQALKMPTSLSHRISSSMALNRHQFKEAIEEAERAIALDPNDASCHYTMAEALVYGGNPNKGIEYIETAMRLDPRFQTNPLYLFGIAHFCMGQYEKAVSLLERALKRIPAPGLRLYPLVAAYAHLGRINEAIKTVDLHKQQYGLHYAMYRFPFKDPEVAERFVDGLIKADYPASQSEYYKIYEENRLTGEDVRSVAFGQKVAALDGIVDRTKNGKATYRGYFGKSDKGKSWVEGDLLCDQWQERYGGYKNCYPVFRNPDGSKKNLDEYLSATDFGIITWSPVE